MSASSALPILSLPVVVSLLVSQHDWDPNGRNRAEPRGGGDLAKRGFRVMLGAALTAFMTACVAGLLI